MGEAKRRGSFEERQAQAQARHQLVRGQLRPLGKSRLKTLLSALIAASIPFSKK